MEEILFQLPYGGMAGGGSVKRGNVQATLQKAGEAFSQMLAELIYPTEEQLTENAKDSTEAAQSIASLRQVKAADEANRRYMADHGIPVSGVRFQVRPEAEQAFLARWSMPASAGQPRFKITHPFTGRVVIPPFVNPSTR